MHRAPHEPRAHGALERLAVRAPAVIADGAVPRSGAEAGAQGCVCQPLEGVGEAPNR